MKNGYTLEILGIGKRPFAFVRISSNLVCGVKCFGNLEDANKYILDVKKSVSNLEYDFNMTIPLWYIDAMRNGGGRLASKLEDKSVFKASDNIRY